MSIKTRDIALYGVIIALYIAITSFNPIAYGPIQFRLSEILLLLPFWNKKFIVPCILAVGLANVFSPLGPIDIFVGVLIAVLTYFGAMRVTKHKYALATIYSVTCGVFVGLELYAVFQIPFLFSLLSVTVSQIIITFMGVVLLNQLDHAGMLGDNYHERI